MKYKSFLRLDPVWYYGTSLSTMELNSPIRKKKKCYKMLIFKEILCDGYGFVYIL